MEPGYARKALAKATKKDKRAEFWAKRFMLEKQHEHLSEEAMIIWFKDLAKEVEEDTANTYEQELAQMSAANELLQRDMELAHDGKEFIAKRLTSQLSAIVERLDRIEEAQKVTTVPVIEEPAEPERPDYDDLDGLPLSDMMPLYHESIRERYRYRVERVGAGEEVDPEGCLECLWGILDEDLTDYTL
jgi:cell division protein FtsB